MHIKLGDKVQVMAGKERGQTGTIIRIDQNRRRVVVENLNMVKRHKRPNAADAEGGIIEKEAFIDASNVLVYSESLERGVRTSHRYVGEGGEHFSSKAAAVKSYDEPPNAVAKVRVCAKTGEVFK
jgi:large subunit ribosomal protein L24